MKKLGWVLMALVLGTGTMWSVPSATFADQISLGDSTSGQLTFTGDGAGSVTVSSTNVISGSAFFTGDTMLGTYSFNGGGSFTAGPESASGIFPFVSGSGSETFTFTGADGDTLSGDVKVSFIQDDTTNPKFFGTIGITSISGDAAFTNAFPGVGGGTTFDFTTTALSSGTTLGALASTTGSATAGISSGEVVPEGSTILLLGAGLVGIGFGIGLWEVRRRKEACV